MAPFRKRFLLVAWLALALGALPGCAVIGRVAQLDEGEYRLVRRVSPESLVAATHGAPRFYAQQRTDTLLLTRPDSTGGLVTHRYRLQPNQRVLLLRQRFDLDVFTLPFKIRPSQGGVPVQLNTNFNAAIYLGRRLDFYSLRTKRTTPFGPTPHVRATGLGYGAFVGAGSTVVNLDVTNQRASVAEYEGFVLHGGLAAIYDARAFNIGVATGVDQLMGADGPYWVYRHKPWFGILFGLDLN
jgi:hypothetical protein